MAKGHNLSLQLTSDVGREREQVRLCEFLATTRLLTLTGAGGIGMTRLGQRLADSMAGHFPDSIWLIELAALKDGSLVPQAIAAVLGLHELPGRSLVETLLADLARATDGYPREREGVLGTALEALHAEVRQAAQRQKERETALRAEFNTALVALREGQAAQVEAARLAMEHATAIWQERVQQLEAENARLQEQRARQPASMGTRAAPVALVVETLVLFAGLVFG